MNAFQSIATERVDDDVERTGLLHALERLEGMMASLERALHEDAPALTPVPGALAGVVPSRGAARPAP
jgi:hypothetical protein